MFRIAVFIKKGDYKFFSNVLREFSPVYKDGVFTFYAKSQYVLQRDDLEFGSHTFKAIYSSYRDNCLENGKFERLHLVFQDVDNWVTRGGFTDYNIVKPILKKLFRQRRY